VRGCVWQKVKEGKTTHGTGSRTKGGRGTADREGGIRGRPGKGQREQQRNRPQKGVGECVGRLGVATKIRKKTEKGEKRVSLNRDIELNGKEGPVDKKLRGGGSPD